MATVVNGQVGAIQTDQYASIAQTLRAAANEAYNAQNNALVKDDALMNGVIAYTKTVETYLSNADVLFAPSTEFTNWQKQAPKHLEYLHSLGATSNLADIASQVISDAVAPVKKAVSSAVSTVESAASTAANAVTSVVKSELDAAGNVVTSIKNTFNTALLVGAVVGLGYLYYAYGPGRKQ